MTGKDYKSIRYKRYMTQEFAAKMIGISRFTLSHYERNEVKIPLTVSIKLNKLYNMNEDEIDRFTAKSS